MVEDPEAVIEGWLEAGARRVIVHLESLRNPEFVLEICKKYEAEPILSIDPSVSVDEATPYLKDFNFFQILSVFPGPSGQEFKEDSIDKIVSLRGRVPTAKIEVDGGVNDRTARLAKDAGADILVSGNYIFGSPNPRAAYEKLKAI